MGAAVLALGFTVACGGSSSTDGAQQEETEKPRKESAPQSPTPTVSDSANSTPLDGESDGKALSKRELDTVALAEGDVTGFTIGAMDGDPPGAEKPDKATCRPLTAVMGGAPEPAATAAVYRQVAGKGDADQVVVTEFLTAHQSGDAEKVLADLRAAVKLCAGGFTAQGGEGPSNYSAVRELTAPKAGDDALAFQVTGDFEGKSVPLVFQVVRSASEVATFYTTNLVDAKTPEIPVELVTAQVGKLKR